MPGKNEVVDSPLRVRGEADSAFGPGLGTTQDNRPRRAPATTASPALIRLPDSPRASTAVNDVNVLFQRERTFLPSYWE